MSLIFKISCFCDSNPYEVYPPSSLIQCPLCFFYQHKKCIPEKIIHNSKYICYKCLFTYIDPFLQPIAPLIPPTLIKNKTSKFTFKTKIINTGFIIFRCISFDSKYELNWPQNCVVSINNKSLLSLKLNTRAYNEPIILLHSESMRENCFFKKNTHVYTSFLFSSSSMDNTFELKITSQNMPNKLFYISADLVSIIENPRDIIRKIETVNIINRLCELTKSEENTCIKEIIEMIDIYTGVDYIKIPSRGYLCNHLSVFDLEKFLLMNSKTVKKVCPICHKAPGKLYIDGFLQKKLNENKYKKINKYMLSSDYSEIIEYENIEDNNIKDDTIEIPIGTTHGSSVDKDDETNRMSPIYIEEGESEREKVPIEKELNFNNFHFENIEKRIEPDRGNDKNSSELKQKINLFFQKLTPQFKYESFIVDYLNKKEV